MDLLDAVIGLGSNIFYGASLSACLLVFRAQKEKKKSKKVMFIDAADQVRTGRAQNFLEPEHIQNIYNWYLGYADVKDHVKVVCIDDIKANGYNLNIPLYVEKEIIEDLPSMEQAIADLKESAQKAWEAEDRLKELLAAFIKN